MKGVVILGSTGSIGRNTLDVCRSMGPERVRVTGLVGGSQWELLAAQAREHRVPRVAVATDAAYRELSKALAGTGIEVLCGPEGARALVADPACDTVLAAISGAAGLPAVLEAARRGRRLCLSNKESLVLTGPILGRIAREHGAELIPVDSEHSAIFQALQAGTTREVRRLVLTASGGPFREWPAERIARATRDEALNHPTWKMGPLITIDSATLMNKALEVVEARWLFDLPPEQIDVVIHPQSIIHSLVEFVDGSVMAQMGVPDMRVPIQYALTYPARLPLETAPFDLPTIGRLTFEAVDRARFPALDVAYDVLRRGGVAGAVFNAANEVARAAFLAERIAFPAIVRTTERVLERHEVAGPGRDLAAPSLEEVLEADRWAREEAERCLTS
ncbi:MAG: 1-deoxy-D-xylulose-5-phosphate reductoisomerase [Planctomycetota bacterium]|nr:1-deoxy-D-xylulose-5-phosphate reductoisomerase [Planctomycetota bacterium]